MKLRQLSAVILIWMIIGIIYEVESDITAGCVITHYSTNEQITLFSASIVLLLLGIISKSTKLTRFFFSCEAVIWIVRLLIHRGGYIVGVAPWTPFFTPVYDFIAIFLRIVLLHWIFSKRSIVIQYLRSVVLSTIVILLKFRILAFSILYGIFYWNR